MPRPTGLWMLLIFGCTLPAHARPWSPKQAEFFEKRVRPVLMTTCFRCHGGEKVESKLRIDGRDRLIAGGKHGPAIVPGEPDKSLLVQAVLRKHADIQMPPKKPLPKQVALDLAQWVRDGAVWPKREDGGDEAHWAFKPRKKPKPPAVVSDRWSRNGIDRFIFAKLKEAGLQPSAQADKHTLIRRATFDLTGLPPTPAEIKAFLDDASSNAFAKLVDRLLASKAYGQRWGRHWMDLARYADTYGDAADTPIPEAHLYRDYIIDAFNDDLPYDQFLIEQIAGDKLAHTDPKSRFNERIIATGFIALSRRFNNRKNSDFHLIVDNTIDTIGQSVLGMSLGCARCHDHKFDPITMEDYYGLYGYFASTRYPHAGTEHTPARSDFVPLTADAHLIKQYGQWDRKQDDLLTRMKKASSSDRKKFSAQLKALKKVDVKIAYAVVDQTSKIANARIHKAGNPNNQGAVAARGYIRSITAETPKLDHTRSGRLELARWIASADNPLTTRVMANRIWQYHFGKGIVSTSSTFGSQGTPPTHPLLLDWLANQFIDSGWSFKKMHRLIMLSAAYQQASVDRPEALAQDPTTQLWWRFPPRRLEAEAIRDALLAVSGRLDRTQKITHPFPSFKAGRYNQHRPFGDDYDHDHRSVYLMTRRLGRHPYLLMFDGPDTNASTGQRRASTVPMQALFMMNSKFMKTQSEALAERLNREAATTEKRIQLAHRLAYGREAMPSELVDAKQFLQKAQTALQGEKDPQRLAWAAYGRVILSANEFIYLD